MIPFRPVNAVWKAVRKLYNIRQKVEARSEGIKKARIIENIEDRRFSPPASETSQAQTVCLIWHPMIADKWSSWDPHTLNSQWSDWALLYYLWFYGFKGNLHIWWLGPYLTKLLIGWGLWSNHSYICNYATDVSCYARNNKWVNRPIGRALEKRLLFAPHLTKGSQNLGA